MAAKCDRKGCGCGCSDCYPNRIRGGAKKHCGRCYKHCHEHK